MNYANPSAFEGLPPRAPGLPDGPWSQWSAQELAHQYNARATVDDAEAEIAAYADRSERMLHLPQRLSQIPYGQHADEILDLFLVPGQPEAPLFVFIHGGYWRALGLRDSIFMADAMNRQGVAVASLNYSLAPQVPLHRIVDQCRRAVLWLYRQGPAHGLKPSRAVIAGSSAGAHLAAMVMAHDWLDLSSIPKGWLRAGVLVSGLYDLGPIAATTPNTWLNLGTQDIIDLSPMRHLPSSGCALEIVVAEKDSPAFKQQSLDYARCCRAHGLRVQPTEVAQRNHFDVILDWTDQHSRLSRLSLQHLLD